MCSTCCLGIQGLTGIKLYSVAYVLCWAASFSIEHYKPEVGFMSWKAKDACCFLV